MIITFFNCQRILEGRELFYKYWVLKNILKIDVIGYYYIWMIGLLLELRLRDISVRNVKEV